MEMHELVSGVFTVGGKKWLCNNSSFGQKHKNETQFYQVVTEPIYQLRPFSTQTVLILHT